MNIYKNIILKKVPEFQALTSEQQRISIEVHKHKYIAMWFAALYATTFVPGLISVSLCFITIVILNFVNSTAGAIMLWTFLPYYVFTATIEYWGIYRRIIKKDSQQDVYNKLFDFFTTPWLYNFKVITRKNWRRIKFVNKQFYKDLRGEASNHKCYNTCHKLLKLIRDPELKLAWIYLETWNTKCGHAILIKGDYVYDSNMRRTYLKEKYFRLFKVNVFGEFTYDELENYDSVLKSEAWQAFGIWCRQLGAKRDNDSEQG